MIHYRRVCGIVVLFVISAALTAFDNNFWGTIYDYAANKYWTGFATVAVSIPIHTYVIRGVLPRPRLWSQLLGLAISGTLSFGIYELIATIIAHQTWLQRLGPGAKNWGDEGSLSGLPSGAMFGVHWPSFFGHLPVTLTAACIYGVLWFPLLVWLERFVYPRSETSAALTA